ncbi:Alfa-L-rhamnosidase [Candidatus Burkholderia pumila]|uniref:Alfa-L-rhamnosidase n=1 Tax=Candidatus Burkholderia pumila TaxID=1090375 RepID=A0ABR5HLU7_9BURK|nr:Alfa-L-rhamnosidase [Candidatus Burkholderia pumila]
MGLLGRSDWKAEWIGRAGTVPMPPDIIKSHAVACSSFGVETGRSAGPDIYHRSAIASVIAKVPTFGSKTSSFTLSLFRDGLKGALLAKSRIVNYTEDNEWATTLRLAKPLPPGKYYLRQSDLAGIAGWYTYPDSKYAFGEANANDKKKAGDRKIKWEISGPKERDTLTSELRREFDAPRAMKSAQLYITSPRSASIARKSMAVP